MPHSLKLIAPAFALALGACASQQAEVPADTPIEITLQTSAALEAYLRTVRVTRPGAFAVSPDGRNSFYTYCEDIACAISTYSAPALRGCQSISGTQCVVLYVRNEQRRPFTRSATAAAGRHGSEEQRELDFDTGGKF